MSSIPKDEFEKSLSRLESLAKAQLHHTPQSSRTREWAGSPETDQDEYKDGIDENGTDYNGVKKSLTDKLGKGQNLTPAEVAIVKGMDPRPMIAEKISKGEDLTPAENWAIKGGAGAIAKMCKSKDKPSEAGTPGEQKDAGSVPDTNAGANTDDEIEHDAKKSLEGAVNKLQALQDGIEASPFLYEFTRAMSEALTGVEARVIKSVGALMTPLFQRIEALEKSHNGAWHDQMEFNKSLADGVVAIGHQVEGTAQLANAQASQAARGPTSQLRAIPGGQAPEGVQAINKSFDQPGGNQLSKAQITEVMCDLVKSNKLNRLEVIKYESTGQMSPQVQQQVTAHIQGAGR